MRFRETLQLTKNYLLSKSSLRQEEQDILNKINEDLNYFPRGVLHRDDLIGYGYESYQLPDEEIGDIANRLGSDAWEQLSITSVPIIADHLKFPVVTCPVCSSSGNDEIVCDGKMWSCQNCPSSWSVMKYVLVDCCHIPTDYQCKLSVFPKKIDKYKLYIPISEYWKLFSQEPSLEDIFHVVCSNVESDIEEFTDEHYLLENIEDEKGIKIFGENAYWVSLSLWNA